jgi:hypothetical protein
MASNKSNIGVYLVTAREPDNYDIGDLVCYLPEDLDPFDARMRFFNQICQGSNGLCDISNRYKGEKKPVNNYRCCDHCQNRRQLFNSRMVTESFGWDINNYINKCIEYFGKFLNENSSDTSIPEQISEDYSIHQQDKIMDTIIKSRQIKLNPYVENDIKPEHINRSLRVSFENNDYVGFNINRTDRFKMLNLDEITNLNQISRSYSPHQSEVLPIDLRVKFVINKLKQLAIFARDYRDCLFLRDDDIEIRNKKSFLNIKPYKHSEKSPLNRDDYTTPCKLFFPEHHECTHNIDVVETFEQKVTINTYEEAREICAYYESFIGSGCSFKQNGSLVQQCSILWHFISHLTFVIGSSMDIKIETIEPLAFYNKKCDCGAPYTFKTSIVHPVYNCESSVNKKNVKSVPKIDTISNDNSSNKIVIDKIISEFEYQVTITKLEQAKKIHAYYEHKCFVIDNSHNGELWINEPLRNNYNLWCTILQAYGIISEMKTKRSKYIDISLTFKIEAEVFKYWTY